MSLQRSRTESGCNENRLQVHGCVDSQSPTRLLQRENPVTKSKKSKYRVQFKLRQKCGDSEFDPSVNHPQSLVQRRDSASHQNLFTHRHSIRTNVHEVASSRTGQRPIDARLSD